MDLARNYQKLNSFAYLLISNVASNYFHHVPGQKGGRLPSLPYPESATIHTHAHNTVLQYMYMLLTFTVSRILHARVILSFFYCF